MHFCPGTPVHLFSGVDIYKVECLLCGKVGNSRFISHRSRDRLKP
jgi:hypothetical protein